MKFIASEWIRSADIDMEAIEELKHKENLTPLSASLRMTWKQVDLLFK